MYLFQEYHLHSVENHFAKISSIWIKCRMCDLYFAPNMPSLLRHQVPPLQILSLDDVIGLRFLIQLIHNPLRFRTNIRVDFGSGFLLVATKLIKSATNIIKKFKFNKKRLNLYQNGSKKSKYIIFIYIGIFDLLIDNFDLLIA